MAVHALTEVAVSAGRAREALGATMRLGRQLARRPGFEAMRVFRWESDADALIVLTDWTDWEAAVAAETATAIAPLLDRVRSMCDRWESRRLETLFHVRFPRRSTALGMALSLRTAQAETNASLAYQKEVGLKAMTLPGTIGVLGGRCAQDPLFHFFAVEFDSDEALIDFLGSRAGYEWSRTGTFAWWRKDPRLEVRLDGLSGAASKVDRRAEELGCLSVRVETSADGGAVVLRLHGRMDDAAAEKFVKVRDAVVARGCRELSLDVSALTYVSGGGMTILLETARQVKEVGGRFKLTDSQGRFNHILRVHHLNRVLSLGRDGAPRRRKLASVRIRPPGSA